MSFDIHPSSELVQLFKNKPFQGQNPKEAKIIFLSSDANYSSKITNHEFFKYIIEYQGDGVSFWKKYRCHHPFLLENYPFKKNTGGVPFHKRFSKLGLTEKEAEYISFIELLDIPTIGNSSQKLNDFHKFINPEHLKLLDDLFNDDSGKLFLVSKNVLNTLNKIKKEYNLFQWYEKTDDRYFKELKSNAIVEIYHFSSSHIFTQIDDISSMIFNWIDKSKS